MSVVFTCPDHPKYQAKRKPKKCDLCWCIWYWKKWFDKSKV